MGVSRGKNKKWKLCKNSHPKLNYSGLSSLVLRNVDELLLVWYQILAHFYIFTDYMDAIRILTTLCIYLKTINAISNEVELIKNIFYAVYEECT